MPSSLAVSESLLPPPVWRGYCSTAVCLFIRLFVCLFVCLFVNKVTRKVTGSFFVKVW